MQMVKVNRRFDSRLPMELYLNAYVHDELQKGFTTNISETGIFVNTLRPRDPDRVPHPPRWDSGGEAACVPTRSMHDRLPPLTTVGLEFTLPGMNESIWAAGEIRFDAMDDYFLGRGISFTAMAVRHARMLRHYCYHLRATNRRRR